MHSLYRVPHDLLGIYITCCSLSGNIVCFIYTRASDRVSNPLASASYSSSSPPQAGCHTNVAEYYATTRRPSLFHPPPPYTSPTIPTLSSAHTHTHSPPLDNTRVSNPHAVPPTMGPLLAAIPQHYLSRPTSRSLRHFPITSHSHLLIVTRRHTPHFPDDLSAARTCFSSSY